MLLRSEIQFFLSKCKLVEHHSFPLYKTLKLSVLTQVASYHKNPESVQKLGDVCSKWYIQWKEPIKKSFSFILRDLSAPTWSSIMLARIIAPLVMLSAVLCVPMRFLTSSIIFWNFLMMKKFFMKTCEAMDIPIKKQRMRYTEDEKRCLGSWISLKHRTQYRKRNAKKWLWKWRNIWRNWGA